MEENEIDLYDATAALRTIPENFEISRGLHLKRWFANIGLGFANEKDQYLRADLSIIDTARTYRMQFSNLISR